MTHERKVQLWIAGGFIGAIVIITIIAGIFGSSAPASPSFTATETSAVTSSDWVRGNSSAKVSVIEYGDFQCPACAAYEPIVEQIIEEYGNDIQFVFRHFPLSQIHKNAQISSQAAEAAGLQGKFWEMHDMLYQNQKEWSETPNGTVVGKYFDVYAKEIGLDVAKFDVDIQSAGVKQAVQDDLAAANAAKVDHTPTFFVNLKQIVNPNSYAEAKVVIEAAIAASLVQ